MNTFELEEERRQQAVKLDYFQVIKNRHPIIILTLLLVLITAALISYLWTARYQATAKFQIYNFSNPVNVQQGSVVRVDQTMGGNFFQNQVEIIKSPETLRFAVENSDLADRWKMNTEGAINRIRAGLRVSPSINTEIVTLTFRDEDRDTAREVITRVVDAYESHRVKTEMNKIRSGLASLETMIELKESDVYSMRQKVLDLIYQYDISPSENSRWGSPELDDDNDAVRLRNHVIGLESELNAAKSNASILRDVESKKLVDMLRSLDLPSNNTIEMLANQLREFESYRQELINEGLGPRHPKMRTLAEQTRKASQDLYSTLATQRQSLDVSIANKEEQLRLARIALANAEREKTDLAPIKQMYAVAQRNFERADAELAEQKKVRDNILLQSEMYRHPIEKLELPKASASTVEPNWTMNFALGGALGLAMGIALAFILEISDTTVRSMEEIEAYLGVPVLAVIPRGIGVLTLQSGASPDAEAYRILRTNIEFNREDNNANLMTIISGSAGEGKTTTLVNLAYVCAQGGYNTLIIDADLRRPQLHRYFDTDNQVGLTTYLTSDLELEDVAVQTSIDHLFFVPSGVLPQDASGLLNSRRMSELLEDVKQRFDLVLIDSPPILGVSDGSVIVSMVDFTVAIVQHRKLPRKLLLRVKQVIDNAGGKLLGVVLNNVDIHSDSQYQYYTSYYTYYAAEDRDVAAAQTVQRRSSTKSETSPQHEDEEVESKNLY